MGTEAMILVDTGPLVAFFDASDNYHRNCLNVLKDLDNPLLTVWPVQPKPSTF